MRTWDGKATASVLAALAAFGIGALCWLSGLLLPLDRAAFDLQTKWLEHRIASDVVIIELDARSLHELGPWPWRRNRHAQLINQLQRLGARRLFIDIDFSAPSSHPDDDAQLAQALDQSKGSIVLPAFWQPLDSQENALILSEPGPALVRNPDIHLGSVNLVPGSDGLVREVADFSALSSQSIPPVWRRLLPPGRRAAAEPLLLDYRIAPESFTQLSYADVLSGRAKPDLARKTVFIGATAIELKDIVSVPVHGALPGVVVQAIAYETGRAGSLTQVGAPLLLAGLFIWAAICASALTTIGWKKLPLFAPVLIVTPLGCSWALYAAFGVIGFPSAFIAVTVTSLAAALLRDLDLETLRSWRALLRLRHQDALLRQIANVSNDGILTLDSTGMIRDANRASAEMLGTSLSALLGRPFRSIAPFLQNHVDQLDEDQPVINLSSDLPGILGPDMPVEIVMTRLAWEESFVVSISMRDVSAQRKREQELHHHATHDSLTQLGNRRLLVEKLQWILANATETTRFAVLMLDLEGFKQVNDIFGHGTGDDLLIELARRLQNWVPRSDCVARVGGDEFALLLSGQQADTLPQIYRELQAIVEAPITVQGVPISLGTRIGVSLYPVHGADTTLLLQRADIALYSAKKNRAAVDMYSEGLDFSSPRRLQMITELRSAMGKEELTLHFQPKVLLSTGEALEVEALCRWRSPVFGDVSPGEFIPLIEASELIRPLTEWTLRRALESCGEWRRRGMPLKVAVNLSARHLQDDTLPQWIGALLRSTEAEAEWLELEITESAIMADVDRAFETLGAIRQLGISLSIDDFGTGYSSLAYLQKLAVNRLKIDKSFVAGLGHSENDKLIVKSTIDLAHGLGLQVIAEGIETQGQYGILQSMGCEYGQGFLIARAMPAAMLMQWYAAHQDDAMSATWHTARRAASAS